MSDYVTKTMLDDAMRKQTDEILDVLAPFIQATSERFDAMETRFEASFKAVEAQLREQNKKYDHLVNTIDGFIARIDNYETELAARDRQMERLLAWARKVSDKTGIPLEDL